MQNKKKDVKNTKIKELTENVVKQLHGIPNTKVMVPEQLTNMYSNFHPGIVNGNNEIIKEASTIIPIEKEDIKRIISMLYSLITYEYHIAQDNKITPEEYDERTGNIYEMINKLLRLL